MTNDAQQFGKELNQYTVKLMRLVDLPPYVEAVAESIVFGSPITGSPGQPDDLRGGQWTTVYEGENAALISCDDPSARSVEDGISHKYGGPITLNSPIGGFHSVGQTRQNFDKIVEEVARKVVGSDA